MTGEAKLRAKRVRELADAGAIQALPLLSAGYVEVLDLSKKFIPTTEEAPTNVR